MLFNSFSFIGVFLPLCLLGWFFAKNLLGMRYALAWLVLASLTFYGMWNPAYLLVLLTSVGVNFWLGGRILQAKNAADEPVAKRWMILGLGFNLLVLGGFKYAYFFASNLFAVWGELPPFSAPILPLAISFVTFQKIAYLVDCRRGLVTRHNALDYLFFVSFFPQLIAGPIVHHRPLIAQTNVADNPLFKQSEALIAGCSFFAIGLAKKVILADSLAHYASPVFSAAQLSVPAADAAWQGMLAYTLQLYFDFSGYSDMAIGLALLFGFRLPINFLSPYQASSMIEFWRRWHMTLSHFLRDYLYIPLGGNRQGVWMRYRNLWLTMLIAGLWHGAGWTFLLWGGLHGAYLLINHAWRYTKSQFSTLEAVARLIPNWIMVGITFLFVALAWVLFRAPDLSTANHMLQALAQLPQLIGDSTLPAPVWSSGGALLQGFLAASSEMGWCWVALGMAIVMFTPNTATVLQYDATPNQAYSLKAHFGFGIFIGTCAWLALKWMAVRPATEFLYFNF